MKSTLDLFQETLRLEADSILIASAKVNANQVKPIIQIFENLNKNHGSLFCIGVGKSGFIAKKIASTFNSLGLRSFFLHPTEALHGDLGQVNENDAAIIISNSGTTEEIIKLLPFLKIQPSALIALVGNKNSPLAKYCKTFIDCSVEKEACINNQAPTSSTAVALAMGDALAVLYEHSSGLTKEGFAKNHPGGKLGKSLSLTTEHLMVPIGECPKASPSDKLIEILLKMTSKPVGLCPIFNGNKFIGILVEGDIRRILSKDESALHKEIKDHYNQSPITIESNELATKALELMENRNSPIGVLPVLKDGQLVGIIRVHDILKAGL